MTRFAGSMALGVRAFAAAALVLVVVLAWAGIVLAAPSGWLALDGSIRSATGTVRDWGNSGSGAPQGCAAGAVDVPGTGGIFNCGTPGAGSNPPSPPALTPAAAADPSIISSAFIVDPIATDTTSCGSGDPTVIVPGSKNGDPIDSYSLTTKQGFPAKDDLGNVYALSHTRSDNGHPELYFAAERLVNNGDSHIDFEFLQDSVKITSACSGSFVGHRTEGDLLAVVDLTNGGLTAEIAVFQWHCAAEPGPQPADGTVCDPSGSTPPQHYQPIANPGTVTFLVNAVDIPCGGWVCRDKITGTTTTVAARDFMEGGIDLQGLPFTGCFNTFLPHTRSAQSFSANLFDFTGPSPLASCRTPLTTSTSTGAGGSVAPGSSVTDTAAVSSPAGFAPTGSVSFFLCGPAPELVAGCPSGGAQVGAAKMLAAGTASSDPTSSTATAGRYCWRTEYAPDAQSQGVYLAATHTNASTECFTVAVAPAPSPTPDLAAPGLPNTGRPPSGPRLPAEAAWLLAAAAVTTLAAWAWRRS